MLRMLRKCYGFEYTGLISPVDIRVGHRSPILLNQIAICRGEIDTNLGIFCRCVILTNSTAN